MIREIIKPNWSIHYYRSYNVGSVFYMITRYTEEPDMNHLGIGDIKRLYVWLSNDNHNDDYVKLDFPFFEYESEKDIENLEPIKQSEPLLVGQFFSHNFYFMPELMTGTPTDETLPTDFIECLIDFKQIADDVFGKPHWDNEILKFDRINKV